MKQTIVSTIVFGVCVSLKIHKERKYINVSVKFENYSYFEAVVL